MMISLIKYAFPLALLGMGSLSADMTTVISEDFDTVPQHASLDTLGWQRVQGSAGGDIHSEWVLDQVTGKKVLRLRPGLNENGEPDHRLYYSKVFAPPFTGGKLRLEVDVKPESHGGMIVLSGGGPFRGRATVYFRNGGEIRVYYDGKAESNWVDLPAYVQDRWYRVTMDVDMNPAGIREAEYSVRVTDLLEGTLHGEAKDLKIPGDPRFLDHLTIGVQNGARASMVYGRILLEAEMPKAAEPVSARKMPGELVPAIPASNRVAVPEWTETLTSGWTVATPGASWLETDLYEDEKGPYLRLTKYGEDDTVYLVSDPFPVEPRGNYELTGLYQTQLADFGNFGEWVVQTAPSAHAFSSLPGSSVGAGRYAHTGEMMLYNSPEGEWRRKTRRVYIPTADQYARLVFILDGPDTELLLDAPVLFKPAEDTRRSRAFEQEVELPHEEVLQRLAARPDSTAEVVQENGGAILMVDGQPKLPYVQMADVVYPRRGYIADFAEHGIDLHFITLFNKTQRHWIGHGEYDMDKLDEVIWNSVRRNPEGNFILYINLLAYDEWFRDFPDASAMNREGEYVTSRHDDFAPASYWSDVYREQVYELIETYMRHIRQQPYARAIVGYYLGGGEDGQFYYQGVRGQRTIQDGQSPGDLPFFRRWLESYYQGDVDALRRAWGDPELTFATAMPPVKNERYPGVFFDPSVDQPVYDFFRFLNEGVALLLTDTSKIIKEEAGKSVIVGAYYGRGAAHMVYPLFAQTHVMFKEGVIDFMGAQGGYFGWREVGSPGILNWVYDSLRRNSIIPMMELDFRTWFSGFRSMIHDFRVARYWNLTDFANAVARDGGKMLSLGGGIWWMEMSGGWFRDDEIMGFLEEFTNTSREFYGSNMEFKEAEIVMIADEDAFFWTTEQVNLWNGPNMHSFNLQQRALYLAGVPLDFYYLSDLLEERPDHYKVYYFVNPYYPSEALREWVQELEAAGKTIIWQYAPGWLTDEGLSVESMESLTGFRFRHEGVAEEGLRSRFVELNEVVAGPAAAALDGLPGRTMGIGVDLPSDRFVITGGYDAPLSRFVSGGELSSALRQDPASGALTVVLGHPSAMTPDFFANLASMAGVHRYALSGDLVFHKLENLIVMHGVNGGEQLLTLREPMDIEELIHGRIRQRNVSELVFDIAPGETYWFRLSPPSSAPEDKGQAYIERDHLHIEVGDYEVQFRESAAWTMGRVLYRGKALISETGANQTVINVQRAPDDPEQDPWIGTGHGREVVKAVYLEVDGRRIPLDRDLPRLEGETFRVIKDTLIGPFRAWTEVAVTADGIEEDFRFEVVGDTSTVRYMFTFMHCFNAFMDRWSAHDGDQIVDAGVFGTDGSMSLNKDIQSLILYSESEGVGAVVAYPEVYRGAPNQSNQLWNRPIDNKHYFRIIPPARKGEVFRLRCRVAGFEASPLDWKEVGRRQVESFRFRSF